MYNVRREGEIGLELESIDCADNSRNLLSIYEIARVERFSDRKAAICLPFLWDKLNNYWKLHAK